jgi:dienelactone hydrolase
MKQLFTLFLILRMGINPASAALKTEVIDYQENGTACQGVLVYDDSAKDKRPGVLIVHDWMGVGPFVQHRAEEVAKLGYVAFAADIYGKAVRPKSQEEAGAQAGKYKNNRPLLRARAGAALNVLKDNPHVDGNRLAAMGYCFGGTTVLELARSGADIRGVVSFHGGLETPNMDDAKAIKCPVLAMTGADDPHVPPEQIAAFEGEMRLAKIDWQLIVYGNAVHSFTNPEAGNDNSKGAAYNEKADKRSWEAMKRFLAEIFRHQE